MLMSRYRAVSTRWVIITDEIFTQHGWLTVIDKQDIFPGTVYLLTDKGWLKYCPDDRVSVR